MKRSIILAAFMALVFHSPAVADYIPKYPPCDAGEMGQIIFIQCVNCSNRLFKAMKDIQPQVDVIRADNATFGNYLVGAKKTVVELAARALTPGEKIDPAVDKFSEPPTLRNIVVDDLSWTGQQGVCTFAGTKIKQEIDADVVSLTRDRANMMAQAVSMRDSFNAIVQRSK